MTIALLPDEKSRLQALVRYRVLGTGPEPAFDRLTSLASRLFRVPIALISLVGGNKQWLKSHHGTDLCQSDREISFCAHTILLPTEAEAFVVSDAKLDARFVDNPLVTGPPGIRFYAGAPLRTPAGQAIGSFCVIDTVPREFSAEQQTILSDLAAAAMNALELRLATILQQEEAAERQRAQKQLEDTHALFSAVINGTTDAVFIKDQESRYVHINPAGAAFLGVTPAEVIGSKDDDYFSRETALQTRAHDLKVMETGDSHTYQDSDVIGGEARAFLTTKSPYRDAAGQLLGVIGIARDTTEQRRVGEALREAKEEAEKANRAKSEFLSRMSHELRTPLNAILGFSQLLEMHELPPQGQESVDHILKAGRHLLKLIDEVLSISRIEAGRLNLSVEAVSLEEITGECVSLVSQMARERNVQCENRCLVEEGHPATYVLADRQRLRQVLLNLLTNAIKYNHPDGQVRIDCRRLPPADHPAGEPARLRLEVSDTGVGLSEEEITRLFTPFERLKAKHTHTEGTGLGLALSKGLVHAMGGAIGVHSVLHEGSVFWIDLPLTENPLAEVGSLLNGGPVDAERNCQGTVLYIEDNLSNSRLVELLLSPHPEVELLSAEQGSIGLEIARSRRPDLILLDLHLPDLPGWEVLAALRADPLTQDIPTVIVSADATPNQIERLRQVGANDYLTKPINVRELLGVLHERLPDCPGLG